MQKIKQLTVALLLIAGLTFSAHAANDSGLLRFPDINNDLVAFVYAGDIWTVNANGGDARQLTSHEGMELFPKISPDGKWIAFSGEYAGNRQVFVMPAEGGTPKQLTWYNSVGMMPPRGGFDNVVLDWTPDSKNILFRSNRTEFGERNGKYFTVSIDGAMEKPLPIVNGGFAVFSPDAKKLCFTPVDREFRTWKRYKGGRATELWIYDLENNTSEQMTDFTGSDQWPVWDGGNIFFASDRDLKLNIYSYNTETKETEKITDFSTYDVMWPSGQNGQLVFENGGFLYKTNLDSGETEKITVNINYDNPNRLPWFKNVKDDIHSYAVSPTGKRALFDARGDIFSVPAENGITQNLTQTQGVREIYPSWSPNGKYIAYYSDATGEYEIYLLENSKDAEPVQISSGSQAWKYDSEWSPDSKYLLYSDRTLNLKLFDVEAENEIIITKGATSEIRDYSFSPDSRWVVYSKESDNGQSAVWVYNIQEKENHQLTEDTFNDYSPVFSAGGEYIFFLSNRDFNLDFSSFEFDYLYNNATRIYAVALQADGPKLLKDKNDTEPVKTDDQKKENNSAENRNGEEVVQVKIDFEGITERVMTLPMGTDNYRNLAAVEGGLLYITGTKLQKYNIEKEESSEIMDKVRQALVSADGKAMLYRSGGNFGITAIKPGIKSGDGKLNLENMDMKIDPIKEWNQIYNDGWRIFRDYFYVENLHEVDWKSIKDKYSKLLPYVGHRADLDYILSEMVSESNTGHAYVNWGDFENPERVEGGLLGAHLEPDSNAGRFRIAEIYPGENWNNSRRSPLTEVGVDVNEGDYLISLNGQEIKTGENPYRFLENSANELMEITVSKNADGSDARTSLIKPIKSELELMYLDWVNKRRQMVEKLSGGRIGYIHVPNTSYEGNRELFRGMYAYHNKEALIIDDRYNGGGFIPDVMADLLERKTLSYWQRNGLNPMQTPGVAHNGPKVMLINGYSSSGGDAFPYYFKKKGLGQLIGTRTWGGLVGISGNASLVDGGSISVPQFGVFDENGEWIIEGIGVYPDIEVMDRPEELAKGNDPSLEKAVEVLLQELEENPPKKVDTPEPPDRSGFIEKDIR
ncbi:tricorn protease [Tangfeifania diversioriginum]|uniref:Tricorn protease homolog n=1 Tax=Tangfeifania diversioriginum TaxID=1168035 RepID=A0A1M6ELN5_9BACT|nr:S41 family peptidase [Tangfeifania diversioriginum]SHI86364.1 tricorn protease [Tangfeifania diversioriginum]